MTPKLVFRISYVLTIALIGQTLTAKAPDEPDQNSSPRLTKLVHELEAGNRQALATFWQEMKGKAPLVEPITGAKQRSRITFIWRGDDKTKRVSVFGGLPYANLAKPLKRVADTDLWFLTEDHSNDARFQYVFQINGPEKLPWKWSDMMKEIERAPPQQDPINPRNYAGWSYIELPDAPPQPWIKKQGNPAGLMTRDKFKSKIMNAEYSLNIYTPAIYDKSEQRCWLAVGFDGGFLNMPITLDNLLAAGKIPPLVVVGVKNINRERDLGCSDKFANFLATELVPWARKKYRVYDDPSHTLVGGTSLGGKMAAWCGLKHSDVFGKVLSQSGSFATGAHEESAIDMWKGEAPAMVVKEFLESPRLPVEFYLEVGRYETTLPFTPGMRSELRDVAEAGRVWLVFGRRLVMSGDRAARGTALAEAGRLGFGRPRFAVRPRS